MNLVLAAEESAGLKALRMLVSSRHRLIAVLARPPRVGSTGSTIWRVAEKMGVETWPASLVKDAALANRLREGEIDVLLNVHSLFIICSEVLAAPRLGAFNLHPGPLPRYAGLNAVSWAIYRGEHTHGVTVHKMEPGIDTGAIVYQTLFPIEHTDTALTLSFKCIQHGMPLLLKLLDVASANPVDVPFHAQNLSEREYFGAAGPQHGFLTWDATADSILNFIRACDYFPFPSPWGYPRTHLGNHELGIVKARKTGMPCKSQPGTVGTSHNSGVEIACADEWLLVEKIKLGSKYVSANEMLTTGEQLQTII